MSAVIPAPDDLIAPTRFTQETLDWVPWVEPLPIEEVTEHHYEALVQRSLGEELIQLGLEFCIDESALDCLVLRPVKFL